VPNGLIHDWIGAVFIPHATVDEILARVQDSKLISHDGNDFQILLRLFKRKSSPSFSTQTTTCIICRWIARGGFAAPTPRALLRWKTWLSLSSSVLELRRKLNQDHG